MLWRHHPLSPHVIPGTKCSEVSTFWVIFLSIWLLWTVQILLSRRKKTSEQWSYICERIPLSQNDQNNFPLFSSLGKRLRTDINVSFCLRGRLEEIGAVATVERAMGVKRELNAHEDEREEGGLTYHKCQPRAGNIFIKCSCNKYPHIPVHIGAHCTSFCSDICLTLGRVTYPTPSYKKTILGNKLVNRR